ncbi:hypothetical protein SCUP515_03703 [Seiridium cupressi]
MFIIRTTSSSSFTSHLTMVHPSKNYIDMRNIPTQADFYRILLYQRPPRKFAVLPTMGKTFYEAVEANNRQVLSPPKMAALAVSRPALDALIVMARVLLYYCLDDEVVSERRLLDIALHDFGHSTNRDFLIKGILLRDISPPAQINLEGQHDQEMNLFGLLKHSIVQSSIFEHRDFHLVEKETWTRVESNGRSEYRSTSQDLKTVVDISHVEYDGKSQLSDVIGTKFREMPVDGGWVLCFCAFPTFIAVTYQPPKGACTSSFKQLRQFEFDAPCYEVDNGVVKTRLRHGKYRLVYVYTINDGMQSYATYRQDGKNVVPLNEDGPGYHETLGESGSKSFCIYTLVDDTFPILDPNAVEYLDPEEDTRRLKAALQIPDDTGLSDVDGSSSRSSRNPDDLSDVVNSP